MEEINHQVLGDPTSPTWGIIQLYPGDCWTGWLLIMIQTSRKLHMLMGSKSWLWYVLMGTDVYCLFLVLRSWTRRKQGLKCWLHCRLFCFLCCFSCTEVVTEISFVFSFSKTEGKIKFLWVPLCDFQRGLFSNTHRDICVTVSTEKSETQIVQTGFRADSDTPSLPEHLNRKPLDAKLSMK